MRAAVIANVKDGLHPISAESKSGLFR